MARITALARMMKAGGSAGQMDWLRAHVFLGLLLGTLPQTPAGPATPSDQPPPMSRQAAPRPMSHQATPRPMSRQATPRPMSRQAAAGPIPVPCQGLSDRWPTARSAGGSQVGEPRGSSSAGGGPAASWPGIRPYVPSWLPTAGVRPPVAGLSAPPPPPPDC